jgi:hypothetical protein
MNINGYPSMILSSTKCLDVSFFALPCIKARTYSDVTIFQRMCISSGLLEAIARFRSKEAKKLRNAEAALEWELDMMRGGMHRVNKAVVEAAFDRANSEKFGMDIHWHATADVCAEHILVVVNDHATSIVWDFACSCILEWEARIYTFTEGLPRRQTLVLSPDEKDAEDFIEGVKTDLAVFNQLAGEGEWAAKLAKASPFQQTSVQQLWKCLQEEDWSVTERLIM